MLETLRQYTKDHDVLPYVGYAMMVLGAGFALNRVLFATMFTQTEINGKGLTDDQKAAMTAHNAAHYSALLSLLRYKAGYPLNIFDFIGSKGHAIRGQTANELNGDLQILPKSLRHTHGIFSASG